MKLYEEGDYALALLEFERAHSLVPGFRVLYNIAQVNIQLGRYAQAARKLRQYLAEGRDEIPPDRKASVIADLEMLAGRTATVHVDVNVEGAEILLDSDHIATSPMQDPRLVDAGEHRVTVRKSGYVEVTRPVALAGRDYVNLDVVLQEIPRTDAPQRTVFIEPPKRPEVDGTDSRRTLWLTLGWSGTGLLAAAWATTGYLGLRTARDRERALEGVTSAEEVSSLKRETTRWYIASDICGGLTVASAAAMMYYTFVARPTARSRLAVDLSPGHIQVSGRF